MNQKFFNKLKQTIKYVEEHMECSTTMLLKISKIILLFFDFVEIEALNKDIKANDWGLLPIEQYENAVELLKII